MIEVRLLGDLTVRRVDGTVVQPNDWKTGKAADLFRLLALEAGRPVRIGTLLDRLWPDVDETRGRASLRTAASAVRSALGVDCVERQLSGIALRGVTVDIDDFKFAAIEAKGAMRRGDFATALRHAQAAESHYRGEFRAHNDDADWAHGVRECLGRMRLDILADGADAALELGLATEAVDLATRLVDAEPTSERAHRTLMRGYAALGEYDAALRVFDRCRRMLVEDLGVDPSPRTLAVHSEVLAAGAAAAEAPRLAAVARRTDRRRARVVPDLVEEVQQYLRRRYPGQEFDVNVALAGTPAGLAG
jgi:SARP family transcriptional regulator, regulator of embCAB operon